MLSDTFDITA